jgi:FtsZ-binding cell division protein ZapB
MTALQERYDAQSAQLTKLSETNRLQCMEIKELKELARNLTRREREFQAAHKRLLKELNFLKGRLCPDGKDIVINQESDVLAPPADGGWEKPLPPIIKKTHSEEEVMDREATLKPSDMPETRLHKPIQSIGDVVTDLPLKVAKAETLLELRHIERNEIEQSIGACKIEYNTLKRKIIKCKELWEFEKHMGGVDTLSMEGAIHRLDHLNLKIFEAASAMVSTMACYKDRQRYLGQDLMATVDKAKKIRSYTLSLEGADHTTAVMQIVLQTAMVTLSASLILAWRPGDESANNALQHTYDMIRASAGEET